MIRSATDPRWLKAALEDFNALLVDHAHCEKKAAATALSLVSSYPEYERVVQRMSALAIEELRHFRAVLRLMRKRGVVLTRDPGDPYVQALLKQMRHGHTTRLVDRLLVAGVIEARSHERLGLLADALDESELAAFYRSLARAITAAVVPMVTMTESLCFLACAIRASGVCKISGSNRE